jgi:hypothetical protein
MTTRLMDLLEQTKSDDAGERYEAFDELCDEVFNQGTPGLDAVAVIDELFEMIRSSHPVWPDVVTVLVGIAIDLARGPAREGKEELDRATLLNAFVRHRSILAETLERPCELSGSNCAAHNHAVEILVATLPNDRSFVDAAMQLVRSDPDAHAAIRDILS